MYFLKLDGTDTAIPVAATLLNNSGKHSSLPDSVLS